MPSKRLIFVVVACSFFQFACNELHAAGAGKDLIQWSKDLSSAQQEAAKTGKLILIHFSGENCPPCLRVERNVFGQQSAAHQINARFATVNINATTQPHIARQFQVSNWPTDLVLTADGQELHRMTSPQDPQIYVAELGKAAWRAYNLANGQMLVANSPQAAQTPQRQVATQSVPQQTVARPKPITQAIQQANTLTLASAQPGYQPSILPPRNAVGQPQQTFAKAKAAAVTAAKLATAGPNAVAVENKFATGNQGSQPAVAQASAAMTPAPLTIQPAAPVAQTNPPAPQPTTHRPSNDLYPQATVPNQQTQRIAAANKKAAAIRPVAYDENTQDVSSGFKLPPAQNPFDPAVQRSNGTGALMLSNPFLTKKVAPQPVVPQPVVPQPVVPQPVVPQPAATQPVVPQPQSTPLPLTAPTDPQVSAQTKLTFQRSVAHQQPTAQLSLSADPIQPPVSTVNANPTQSVQIPTPALTPAVPPQSQNLEPVIDMQLALEPPAATDVQDKVEQPKLEAPADAAMDGYCSVTLHHDDDWVKGDPRWGAQHRGKVFLFHSAHAQERFLNDPDKYSPLLSGFDPVVFHETGELKAGFRAHGIRYQDMTCLFSSEESLQRFWASPKQYTQTAHQAMHADTTVR